MGERRGAYRVLVEKPEERKSLKRPRLRWDDNIKMDLLRRGMRHGLDRYGLRQRQAANCYKCDNEPSGCIKCGEIPEWLRTC
jgi:hypothetical protein